MKHLILSLLLIAHSALISQVVVNNNLTVEAYIQNVLVGQGVSVSNIQFNGGPANIVNEQVGEFTDATSSIGLPSGLILGSGDVSMGAQPNTGTGSNLGGTGNSGNDIDLASITPNNIYDEAVIEFDFVPVGDSISFSYVFASEEYPEYVCGSVNDAFGFFLSGTNPSGGLYSATNLALIPDPSNPNVYTSTPVSINTVNPGVSGANGTAATCASIDPNWASYNVFYAGNNTTTNYEYDGNTVVLTCKAAVVCNETYHIKLAIGDGGDGAYDSGVFLEGGSFTSVGISVEAGIANGATDLYEGCNSAFFAFTRPDTTVDFTVHFVMSGTSLNGFDYLEVPDSLTLTAGQFTDTLFIYPNVDGIDEPQETIEMLIIYENCAGGFDTISASLTLNDYTPFFNELPDSLNICPAEIANLNPVWGGGLPPINISWSSGQTADSISVSPEETKLYVMTLSDDCGLPLHDSTLVWVQCPITAPNVFTPNGDSNNEFFIIKNLDDYSASKLTIFNRWGKIVYQNDDYQNDWNGKHYKSGRDVDSGTYYYIVAPNSNKYLYDADNKKEELRTTFSGYFQIMR